MKLTLIVARINGLDGVALQVTEYANVLSKLGYEVEILTGEDEKELYGRATYPDNVKIRIDKRLSLHHKERIKLYKSQFKGTDQSSEKAWEEDLIRSSQAIFDNTNKIIQDSSIVIIFNFLALRHYHPAAAVGMRSIVRHNQKIPFISHAADPDSERPEKTSQLSHVAGKTLSSRDELYCGGPLDIQNLCHIVLNPWQEHRFRNVYGITKIFQISDIVKIPENKKKNDINELISVLNKHKVSGSQDISIKDTFFVSPVRPIRRKRLKEAIDLMRYYDPKGVFVVTHPDKDDPEYALEVADYATKNNIRYVYLGDECNHGMLEDLYEGISPLNSVSVIASNAGGFENAILESMSYNIPVIVSNKLNSYPVLDELGFRIGEGNFEEIENCSGYITKSFDTLHRKEIVTENKEKLCLYFSRESAQTKIEDMLTQIKKHLI